MQKTITYQQFQSVRAIAKAIDPIVRKINPIKKKINDLEQEMKAYQQQVTDLEAGIFSITGFHVSELVKKVVEPTGAVDKEGRPIKTTKYIPTDIVTYDKDTKQYIVTIPNEETIVPPTVEAAGSDFDMDAEAAESVEKETEQEDILPFQD